MYDLARGDVETHPDIWGVGGYNKAGMKDESQLYN